MNCFKNCKYCTINCIRNILDFFNIKEDKSNAIKDLEEIVIMQQPKKEIIKIDNSENDKNIELQIEREKMNKKIENDILWDILTVDEN